jgi:hypothetical protein
MPNWTSERHGPRAGEESLERLGQAGFSAGCSQAAEKEMGFRAKIEEEIENFVLFFQKQFWWIWIIFYMNFSVQFCTTTFCSE